jgi:hypothetical protein
MLGDENGVLLFSNIKHKNLFSLIMQKDESLFALNLPNADSGNEIPGRISGYTSIDHCFIFCSRGIVPPHPCSVRFCVS